MGPSEQKALAALETLSGNFDFVEHKLVITLSGTLNLQNINWPSLYDYTKTYKYIYIYIHIYIYIYIYI